VAATLVAATGEAVITMQQQLEKQKQWQQLQQQ